MTHRLRHDTRIFASGFFLTRDEIKELAQRALSPDFLACHFNDAVLAFKWHIREHACEVITTSEPNRFLVAVHFFPWVIREPVPRKLADIPKERRELWSKHYRPTRSRCQVSDGHNCLPPTSRCCTTASVAEQAFAYRGEEDEDAETGACFKKDVSRGAGRRRERRRTRRTGRKTTPMLETTMRIQLLSKKPTPQNEKKQSRAHRKTIAPRTHALQQDLQAADGRREGACGGLHCGCR
ncbi:hypothetical protein B0H14DRAFT_3124791 [Mycena olivaceomarginata]|nr:hypothetical protein B0H14DRAFT_3124791 [Mycena olivaceomarginata]